jgi:hypothetical protein
LAELGGAVGPGNRVEVVAVSLEYGPDRARITAECRPLACIEQPARILGIPRIVPERLVKIPPTREA